MRMDACDFTYDVCALLGVFLFKNLMMNCVHDIEIIEIK